MLDASGGDVAKHIKQLTAGGVHHAIECVGLKATVEDAFKMLRRGGTATVVGMIPVGVNIELHGPEFLAEKKIQGSYLGSNASRSMCRASSTSICRAASSSTT